MHTMKNHRLPIRSWTQKAYACNPIHVGTFPAIRISLKPTSNETDETLSEVNANDARKNPFELYNLYHQYGRGRGIGPESLGNVLIGLGK